MREVLSDWEGGVSIGGERLTNLRYADDTTLIACDEQEMTALLKRLETVSNALGLSINKSKTKVMVVDRSGKLDFSGTTGLEMVEDFVYLGSNISNQGGCEQEVRRRIGMAKSAMAVGFINTALAYPLSAEAMQLLRLVRTGIEKKQQ